MIKTFIFVEDGSVDLDELKSSVGDDVLVISYRQGATPPAIQQPKEPVSQNSCMEQLKAENFSLREQLIAITEFALEMCGEDAREIAGFAQVERMSNQLRVMLEYSNILNERILTWRHN